MLMISDANVLIDLEEGELIEQLFRLPYKIYCPDTLFYEELEEQHYSLLDLYNSWYWMALLYWKQIG